MIVKINNNRYTFYDENDKYKFEFNYALYPGCCIMGIIYGFSIIPGININDLKEDELKYILSTINSLFNEHNINQLLIADLEDCSGYNLALHLDAVPLTVNFNRNTGNTVYLFSYYGNRE